MQVQVLTLKIKIHETSLSRLTSTFLPSPCSTQFGFFFPLFFIFSQAV